MPLVEIIAAGAAVTQAGIQLLQALNGARAVFLEVDNNTGLTLNRVSDEHQHGGFAVTPTSQIPPHTADTFGSQNKGG